MTSLEWAGLLMVPLFSPTSLTSCGGGDAGLHGDGDLFSRERELN
jgi:hypothetical protein